MTAVRVKGAADAAELAAVLAVLARDAAAPPPSSAYDRWRAQRLRALRRTAS